MKLCAESEVRYPFPDDFQKNIREENRDNR